MEDNNNNLEKYFKQIYNQNIEPAEWNIPDNGVWDNISSQMSSDNKKRRFAALPHLLAALALLSCVVFGYNNHLKNLQIGKLKEELNICQKQSVTLQMKNNTEVDKTPFVTSSEGKQNISVSKLQNNNQHDVNNPMPVAHTVSNQKELKYDNKPTPLVDNALQIFNSTNILNEISVASPREVNHNNDVKILYPLDTKDQRTVHSERPKIVIFMHDKPDFISPKVHPSGFLSVGGCISYIQWLDNTHGNFNNPLSGLLVEEKTTPSVSLGIAINKKISRHFVFNTGINYYNRNQESRYALNLPYSTTNEITVGAEYENRFQHSLPTGLGTINTNLILARSSNSVVQDNENVFLDFSLTNVVKAIVIPTTLSYYINNAGKGFFIQSGLATEWILQNKITDVTSQSHHTLVHGKFIGVDYNKSQINKLNVNALLGIGYQKEIDNGIHMTVSSNYNFALTNTFSTPTYRHNINQMCFQLMVTKEIK